MGPLGLMGWYLLNLFVRQFYFSELISILIYSISFKRLIDNTS